MDRKPSSFIVLATAFLITGNLVGAGILALPVKTGLGGFVPSLLGMVMVGIAMFFTALILGKEATETRQPSFNYPSLYRGYLGAGGKWIAIAANLIILYGLLTAYLTGATSIITNLFPVSFHSLWITLILFAGLTLLNVSNVSIIRRYNVVLMVLLWIAFGAIVFVSERHVEVSRLNYADWVFLPAAFPIILTAFHFHNIIPSVCQDLQWDSGTIWKAMLVGVIIGFGMNALWIQVGVGVLPVDDGELSLVSAFENNLPATVPLSKLISSPVFMTGSLLFALLAISTSYLANGLGLLGFMHDFTENHIKISSRLLTLLLSFGPPLAISLAYPDIFLKALDVVGGVGIVVLFGILPCLIGIKKASGSIRRALCVFFLILFGLFLILELAQEGGVLRIQPHVEYWKHQTGQEIDHQ